ncbi:hypothetical protein LXL04_013575 [Taraxacum kok-saghyz]
MAFPDAIHAFKPNPKSHIQEDRRILDFLSHHPESLNTMKFWLDDVGILLIFFIIILGLSNLIMGFYLGNPTHEHKGFAKFILHFGLLIAIIFNLGFQTISENE